MIGDRRPPSPLGKIQPDGWLSDYTTELLNVLNVLGRLIALEPKQAALLARICDSATIPAEDLRAAMAEAAATPSQKHLNSRNQKQGELLG